MHTFVRHQSKSPKRESSKVGRPNVGPGHLPHFQLPLIHVDEPSVGLRATASPRFELDFSRIVARHPGAGIIQTKLAINTPGDEYEQEADHLSEQVMRMPEPQRQRPGADGQPAQPFEPLRTKRVHGDVMGQAEAPPIVHEVLRSPGQSLDRATRSFMEARFAHDFSNVQVHTGEKAEASTQALHARAYTAGNHIVFARSDAVTSDRPLMAHELTHTLQQDRGPSFIQRSPSSSRWKNDVRAARYRGQLMAHRLRTHTKLSKEARQKINSELALFEGAAKEAYLAEVKPALVEVVPIEMPEATASKPFKAPKPLPLMLDPADPSMCGGGKCYTEADTQALLDELKPKETAEEKRVIDDQLEELRKKTADWGGYQGFAVSLLEMALREKQLHDPRSVAIVIRNPILAHYRAWLMAIDAARMQRWNKGEIGAFEARRLRGNGDPPDKSWFAKDGNQRGPSQIEDLRRLLALDAEADESAVDHVYYQVRHYRQRTDPHEIEMAGLAADLVNAFVGLATVVGEGVNAGEPLRTAEPGVNTAEPPPPEPNPPAQTIKASPPPPPQQTSRPGAPTPVTDVEVVKTNVDSPGSIRIESPTPHQTDWTVRGGTGKAPSAYRDNEGTVHVSTDHPLMGDPNRGGISPVRPEGKTPPVQAPSRPQPAPSSPSTKSGSNIGLEDTGKAPAPAKPAVDPGAKTPPAPPQDAPVPKDAPTGGAAAESKRAQAPRGQIDPPQAVSREVVEKVRNRPRTVDPRRKGSGSNVHYTADHEAHELAWKRLGGHGDSPAAFVYDNQVYLDPSRWKD